MKRINFWVTILAKALIVGTFCSVCLIGAVAFTDALISEVFGYGIPWSERGVENTVIGLTTVGFCFGVIFGFEHTKGRA